MLAFQLATMPLLAAGIINGVCHAKGYRNFETNDASTNLWPIGLFVAGEELHNNHHAFPTSARFSMRPRELDMGWLHIKVLEKLGLAKIRRVATQPVLDAAEPETTAPGAAEAPAPDLGALRAVMMNRMHVLRHYMHNVTLPVLQRELEHVGENTSSVVQRVRQWLSRHPELLDSHSRERLAELAAEHPAFATALEYRNELKSLWEGAYTSNEKLLADFRAWCASAEASGIQALQEFVTYLKSFRSMPEPAAV